VDNLRLAMTKETWSNPAGRDAAIVRGGIREAVPRATLDKYDMINNTDMPTIFSLQPRTPSTKQYDYATISDDDVCFNSLSDLIFSLSFELNTKIVVSNSLLK